MSAVSSKDKNMLMVAFVAVLYAFAALSFKKQSQNWKVAERVYGSAKTKLTEERALIAAKDEWAMKYEQMRDLMPVFPYEQDVDTHWLGIMDAAATRNGLTIARRQASREVEVGDVYELPIDCKDWEGSLESLVTFLHDLHKEGAMLDVRQLFIRPSNRPGFLKGTFTLYCAYMRGNVERVGAGVRRTPEPEPEPQVPAAVAGEPGVDAEAEGGPAPAEGVGQAEPEPVADGASP